MKSRASSSKTASLVKPSGPTPIERMARPFQEFSESEAAGGVLLLAATALALAWANSPWAESYSTLWEHKFTMGFDGFALSKSILHWINDGLMAIFFFVVGLEIKRELLVGELASPRHAVLPIAGALGGVVVPALLYLSLNAGGPGAAGWGIPMATDIAFAMGAMALLGSRVPVGLKVFLTALAIVDDIVAVLVIAIFYTGNLSWLSLGVAGGFFAALIAASILGMRHPLPYALLGLCLWAGDASLRSSCHDRRRPRGVGGASAAPDRRGKVHRARAPVSRSNGEPRGWRRAHFAKRGPPGCRDGARGCVRESRDTPPTL